MNLRTAKKIAALFYEIHKIMLQEPNANHAYIVKDRTMDAQMQVIDILDILNIEKHSIVPIIIDGPDPEIDDPNEPYPYEVGITIESMYFFANCNLQGLQLYGLPIPGEKEKIKYSSK